MPSNAMGVEQQMENGSGPAIGNSESEDVGSAETNGFLEHQSPVSNAIPVQNGWSAPTEMSVENVVNYGMTVTAPPIGNEVREEERAPSPDPASKTERVRSFNREDPHFRDAALDVLEDIKLERLFDRWKDKRLCGNCEKLNLTADKFIIQDHSSDRNQQAYRSYLLPQSKQSVTSSFPLGSGSGKYSLGPLRDIFQKSGSGGCPLCFLVVKSLVGIREIKDVGTCEEGGTICYASWQVDGRELIRNGDGTIVSTRPRTRRIRLHWNRKDFPESYLVLVAPEPEKVDQISSAEQQLSDSQTLFLGRNINSAGNNQVLVKKWLDLCHAYHSQSCEVKRGRRFEEMITKSYFGVVDVHEMRLTPLPPKEKYIALSYVWGEGQRYTTQLDNVQKHRAYGGIEKVESHLPRVIRDAIKLVRALGERYLWVDSLCIVQDSESSWSLNAQVMDLVYGNAHLTICAADGDGATTGLKGLEGGRYVQQYSEMCTEEVNLMVSHLAETYIKKSRWSTRAWTFQERLLSKRSLIFVGNRVYFQCRSTAMSEDIFSEHKDPAWSIELVQAPPQMLNDLRGHAFRVYMTCIELYTNRTLSRSGDILAAFNGMSNLIGSSLGAPLVFGLPSSHFDLALLWEARDRVERRAMGHSGKESSGMEFPTWSWCGWQGSVTSYKHSTIEGCLPNVHQWLTEHTWINWHIRDSHGSLRPVWDRASHREEDVDVESRWRGYTASVPSEHTLCDSYGRPIREELRSLEQTKFYRTLPEYPYCVSMAEPCSGSDRQLPDQRYLQFWTWSTFLRLIPHDQPPCSNMGKGVCRYDIADYTGDWCGTIVLDQEWGAKQAAGSKHEFVAISEAKNFTSEENDIWTYYIPKEKEQSDWDLYYVLLVEHRGHIAHRVGLGKVFKEAFSNPCLPGTEWKEFILG